MSPGPVVEETGGNTPRYEPHTPPGPAPEGTLRYLLATAEPPAANPGNADSSTYLVPAAAAAAAQTSPTSDAEPTGDVDVEWTERSAVAAASQFVAELPCSAENPDQDCEYVDLVLPPTRVWAADPTTFLIALSVRISTSRAQPGARGSAGRPGGCRFGTSRFEQLVIRVVHVGPGPVRISLENGPAPNITPAVHMR